VCFPLSFFRRRSEKWERDKNDVLNFLTLNFKSLPRFYEVLFLMKLVRIRRVQSYLRFALKKSTLRVQAQQIIYTFMNLGFIL